MMKYLNKIAARRGTVPAPLAHWKNSVACQTFQNMEKKKDKLKATPGINLWGPNEKLPPNESITRKQMGNRRGTSEKSNDMFKRAKHQYYPEN